MCAFVRSKGNNHLFSTKVLGDEPVAGINVRELKRLFKEQAGELLIRMGYEDNLDW